MKKMLIWLMILLVPACSLACDEIPEAAVSGAYTEFYDLSFWARVDEFHEVAGLLRPDEDVPTLPVQHAADCVMRGFLPNGIIRVAAQIRVLAAGETLFGLAQLTNTGIGIRTEYVPLAEDIIHRELGEETPLCGGSVSLCLLAAYNQTVAERIFPSYVDHIIIGYAYFNGKRDDLAAIAMGDWDGDGQLDLGLTAGWTDEPEAPETQDETPQEEEKQPEDEKKPEQEDEKRPEPETPKKENTAQKCDEGVKSQKTCWKIELDFHLLIQRCQQLLFGQ